jgi:hypothetical protein
MLLALAVVALWLWAWPWFAGSAPLQPYDWSHVVRLGERESRFYLGVLLFEALLVASLTLGWSRLWSARHARLDVQVAKLEASGKGAYAAIAVGSGVLAMAVALAVLGRHPITEDEKTYLFQARLLLGGHLTMPAPNFPRAFWQPFVVEAGGRWSGQYFWAHPALLALGLLVRLPAILPALELMTAVYFTGLLVEEYAGDRRAGLLSALLLATSPLAVLTAGSLHSATLSMACGAVALWSIGRVANDRASVGSTFALGLAVAIGLCNRPLDIAALLTGAGALLFHRHRLDLKRLLRRLLPSVVLALLAMVPQAFLNHAVSGNYAHSGYWLFNEGRGWKTLGFGAGPFGLPHTPVVATVKTLAAWVRVAFYTSGSPYLLFLLILPFPASGLGSGRRAPTPAAPAVIVLVYAVAYFLYASASILTTGPVYYDALMPVLTGWIALCAITWHEQLRSHSWGRRLIPAFLVAQAATALVVFWPAELREVANAAKSSSACERLADRHGLSSAMIFVRGAGTSRASWTLWPPLAAPTLDDPILFATSQGPAEDAGAAARYANGRPLYLARCVQEASTSLDRYDPVTNRVEPLDGTRPDVR